jgi:hypothetical protein
MDIHDNGNVVAVPAMLKGSVWVLLSLIELGALTLWKVGIDTPLAEQVFAKVGTYGSHDTLNKTATMGGHITPEALAGRRLDFRSHADRVPLLMNNNPTIQETMVGQTRSAIYSITPDQSAPFDVIIKNGQILDGTGNPWYAADIGIRGDRIAAIGDLRDAKAKDVVDATGDVVSPGFIDMLGQSEWPLLLDNRSLSKLSQGITTEITGEGNSVAPQNAKTLAALGPYLDHYHLTVDWTTLDGYFRRLGQQGTPLNLGTYVGATQVREAVIGDKDRAPTPAELEQMKAMVAQQMKDGALGGRICHVQ